MKNSALPSVLTFIVECDKSKGVTVPLCNLLLFVVTSYDFVTFKIAVICDCNGTVTGKNG